MRVCPECHTAYGEEVSACPRDKRRPVSRAVIEAHGGDPLLGLTIADRYTIVDQLGAGGMGTVYRAEQALMRREIALKVLRRDLGRDPETVARFQREAHALSQLKHPNTVTVFDFGQTRDDLLYLAMELLEGEMLSARMKREGPMDVNESMRIALGVLRSLAEAHSRGIIHRDLKPDNIFLSKVIGHPDGETVVKVVDFGIAKFRQGGEGINVLQTQEGTVFGTPRYMSPEQAQGKTLDGRSDLYAVGVLLFHMLTGRAPFTDDDAVVVMAHHIKTIPPPIKDVVPSQPCSELLEKVVADALTKNPSNRPQTAEEFIRQLEAALAESSHSSQPPVIDPTPPSATNEIPADAPLVKDVSTRSTVRPRGVMIGLAGVAILGAVTFGVIRLRTPTVNGTRNNIVAQVVPQPAQKIDPLVTSPAAPVADAGTQPLQAIEAANTTADAGTTIVANVDPGASDASTEVSPTVSTLNASDAGVGEMIAEDDAGNDPDEIEDPDPTPGHPRHGHRRHHHTGGGHHVRVTNGQNTQNAQTNTPTTTTGVHVPQWND